MIPNRANPALPLIKVNNEDFWVIEKYLDSRWFRNRFQFKIRWEGFTEEHDTWENAKDIDSDTRPRLLQDRDDDFDLEEDFYRRHLDAPKRTDPPATRAQPAR